MCFSLLFFRTLFYLFDFNILFCSNSLLEHRFDLFYLLFSPFFIHFSIVYSFITFILHLYWLIAYFYIYVYFTCFFFFFVFPFFFFFISCFLLPPIQVSWVEVYLRLFPDRRSSSRSTVGINERDILLPFGIFSLRTFVYFISFYLKYFYALSWEILIVLV